uniref:hypothetical protein n=1 Tax=Okeania sp. SIO2F4 TaxID=2607790 RepID=UPI0025E88493|nr:hypothetical protein [Okeania sp. SIO2F4]
MLFDLFFARRKLFQMYREYFQPEYLVLDVRFNKFSHYVTVKYSQSSEVNVVIFEL